ncbi:MAG: UDP-N-acetylglucosamine 1-carboxyvinyltransferase [Patescibacteria group bacterium]|nr:UDP-N-acetylglucosamine 1-carboxyvinyltransferase [Patescibacteria group bacterium]
MSKFVIEGGKSLKGEINISGMKNAATPILAATLLSDKNFVIKNVPNIADVRTLIEIMLSLGVAVNFKNNVVKVSAGDISFNQLNKEKVEAMRSSILLLAPLLTRFKEVRIPQPGGCIIGSRPIDTHLYVFKKLGAKIEQKNEEYILKAKNLKGSTIILPEFSVTATENAIMAAVLAQGLTTIKMAAAEPHVQDLCNFLNKFGARIKGIGTHTLKIRGVERLKGGSYKIIPDQIEAGTFAVMAAATRSKLTIKQVVSEHLESVVLKLKAAGVKLEEKKNYIKIKKSRSLKSFKVQTMPYPGFPTDLQAPFSVLATQCPGTSLIHDPLFENRMSHIKELMKMGANATICDPHRVLITGPTPLFGQFIKSPDLRAGATLIIAGLIAEGTTEIDQAEIIDRGYEDIDRRLKDLGADIKRINNE